MLPPRRHSLVPAIAAIVLTTLSFGALAPDGARAARVAAPSADQQVADLEEALSEVSASEAAKLKEVLAARTARAEADGRVQAIDAQMAKATAEQQAAEVQLGETAGRLLAIEKGTQLAQAELLRASQGAEEAALQLYLENARNGNSASDALESLEDAGAALSAEHYLEVVNREQRNAVVRRQQAKAELALQRSRYQGEEAQAKALRDRAAAQRQELDRLRGDLAQAQTAAREAEKAESASLAGIQAQKAQYERELAAARAESEAVKQQLGSGSSGTRPGGLLWPVRGTITSPFGPRPHPIFGVVRYHDGIDVAAGTGTPIRAAASGTVVSAGWRGGYGNATVIDHGGGMATLYGHQNAFAVSAGQRVSAGQVIGYVGSTGNSTGPHLHFEVRINGTPVNPMGYL